jgi:hypothetical protein
MLNLNLEIHVELIQVQGVVASALLGSFVPDEQICMVQYCGEENSGLSSKQFCY